MEAHVWCGADRWSCPAPGCRLCSTKATSGRIWQIGHLRRPCLAWVGWGRRGRSPFSTEDDLAGTSVLFSPSVRRRRCSQVGQDVLRQDALVLRYAPRVILTKSAQKLTPFSGRTLDVLAPLQLQTAIN